MVAGAPRSAVRWLALAALLALAAWLLYRPALSAFFWHDDLFWIDAARRMPGPSGVLDALHTGGVYYYRPAVSLAFAVTQPLFGCAPEGYRLLNLGVHVANALLVAWLGARLLGRSGWGALAAGLWLVYPTHPWAVWWISDISGLLAVAFSLVTLRCWDRYLSLRRRAWYVAALAAFALALLSKEASLALILALPLWEVCLRPDAAAPAKERVWTLRYRYIPFVAVWLVYLALSAQALQARPAVGAAFGLDYFLAPARLQNLTSALFYVGLPDLRLGTLLTRIWNVAGLIGWIALLILFIRVQGALRFIIGWTVIFLTPASALLGFGIPASGRYLYGAAIGASLLLVSGLRWLTEVGRRGAIHRAPASTLSAHHGAEAPPTNPAVRFASASLLAGGLFIGVFAWRNVAQQADILRPQPAYDMSRYAWSRVLACGDAEAFLMRTIARYGDEERREMEAWLAQPIVEPPKVVEELLGRALAAELLGHREQAIMLYNRVIAQLEGAATWDRRSRIGGIVLPARQVTDYARERRDALERLGAD